MEVEASSALVLGPGSTLNVGRNMVVTGALTHNNLPVTFTGSTNSVISGNLAFYDLVVNKSSGTGYVQIGNNATVSHHLDMQSGDLELNTHILDLGTTGTLENETNGNRVTGTAGGTIQATRILNAPSAENVGNLGAVITSAANLGSTLVTRRHNQVVFGLGFGIHRTYGIHPTTNSALNATLVSNYFDDELNTLAGNIMESELDLWRYNGVTWDRQFATINMGANTLTKTGIPQFSDWTAASYVNNPLAIDLAYFRVNCNDNKPVATWKTLSETDSRYFLIEGSANGTEWYTITQIDAAGNSSNSKEYRVGLEGLSGNISQVRLSMVDVNKVTTVFNTAFIRCGEPIPVAISIYPNPSEGKFVIDFGGMPADVVDIQVLNILGQTVASETFDAAGSAKAKMDLSALPAGVYQVKLRPHHLDGQIATRQIIIQ